MSKNVNRKGKDVLGHLAAKTAKNAKPDKTEKRIASHAFIATKNFNVQTYV
jgi:hypothetical protein